MSGDIEPVVFVNAAGQRLFGILHRPAANCAPGTAVLLLSPGIKGRVAPHRLYVKLARRLCAAGFTVLRFDFYGLGDAEGELEERLVADVYASVSVGRYVDDTIAAMDWMQREHGIDRFVLSGLCGGAITGLYAGARDPRVASLVGYGIPVVQYGNDAQYYRNLSSGEQKRYRRGYLRRLLDWKSWLRLLTFRSDFSVIAKVFLSPLKRVWLRRKRVVETPPGQAGATEPVKSDNLNPFFPPAFFDMLGASRKMFLVFGETDRLYWDFDEKFYKRRERELERFRDRLDIYLVKEARHIFEMQDQQEDLLRAVVSWIMREHSSGPVRTVA